MLASAGLVGGAGPERWASGRRTTLAFLHEGGPLMIEMSAGHALPEEQAVSIVVNGVRLDRRSLPILPASERLTVRFEGQPGWNEIEIVYDVVALRPPRVETALLGFRSRARSPVTPGVRFETLRILPPGGF
jgi:hypothetical protein